MDNDDVTRSGHHRFPCRACEPTKHLGIERGRDQRATIHRDRAALPEHDLAVEHPRDGQHHGLRLQVTKPKVMPTAIAIPEPTRMATFAVSRYAPGSNASCAMKSDIVKPMPPTIPTSSSPRRRTSSERVAMRRRLAPRLAATMPS